MDSPRRTSPPWIYALAGWLLAVSELERGTSTASDAEIRARVPLGAFGELDLDPDTMSVRALRRLPAIGPARAVAIARERWERGLSGGPEAWESVRGIGPETVAAIRSRLGDNLGGRRGGEEGLPEGEARGRALGGASISESAPP